MSPLIFRHTIFKERPCIPAMFLIHERKFSETHQEMFRESGKGIPTLKKSNCPIVTDKEQAIIDAIKKELPNLALVQCWNHLFRDVRLWLKRHGAPSTDVAVYLDDVWKLFQSSSEVDYDELLVRFRPAWDPTFEQYYLKQIHPDVGKYIGRWVLEKLHVYNPFSGVTNNQSEGLNRVMKDLQSWKEAPVDCMLLAIYQLQAFYLNEIRRGLAGVGEYHLTEEYATIHTTHAPVEYIPCSSPADIIEKIRHSASKKESDSITEEAEELEQATETKFSCLSMHARAKTVLDKKNISFDPMLHVFNVKGESGITRVVTVFPRETCSCPSSGGCYHIQAVKLSLGLKDEKKPSTRSLTKLRKNTRSRKDKRSGRKRPRVEDVDKEGLLISS